MNIASGTILRIAIACMASVFLAGAAAALDLTGRWVTDVDACDQVFMTKGKKTSFRRDSDMYATGFIIEGRQIRGRSARCTIKTSREDGAVIHMLAACATDIMLSDVQFSVKVLDDNKISRIFPGIDGMELPLYRCPSQ